MSKQNKMTRCRLVNLVTCSNLYKIVLRNNIKHSHFCNFARTLQIEGCSSVTFLQNRKYSVSKMAELQWKDEKTKILELSIEEKRKLYETGSYITLNQVDSWYHYAAEHKSSLEDKKYTEDDLTELKDRYKIKIDEDKNKKLSEKVSVFEGDITKLEIDAIVNAANSALRAGGGVDGAIHKAAGPLLQVECKTLGGCPTGEARITGGYNLPAKYVIHTVGPQNGSGPILQSCYEKSLAFTREFGLKTIAFPCISTGIYGFPNRFACHIALRTARKFLEENDNIDRIIFCTFLPIDVEIYKTLMQLYFPTQ